MIEFSLLCLQNCPLAKKLDDILPVVDAIHLDIMDQKFVPNQAFSTAFVNAFQTTVPKHAHVMALEPERYLEHLTDISSFSFHIEAVPDAMPLIEKVQTRGFAPGIAINPETPIRRLRPFLGDIRRVVLMAVAPGFSGKKYTPETSRRILELRQLNPDVEIIVDGGIQADTLHEVMALGADAGVVCSVIVHADNPQKKVQELKQSGSIGRAKYHNTNSIAA